MESECELVNKESEGLRLPSHLNLRANGFPILNPSSDAHGPAVPVEG